MLVDYTTGLYPLVRTIETREMLSNAVATGKIADLFGLPVLLLGDEGGNYGRMHPAIRALAGSKPGNAGPFERTMPSAWRSGGFRAALEGTGRRQVLIGGVTTDNCTTLTSLDLLRAGYEVFVVADIGGTTSAAAEAAALARLRDAGAVTVGWSMVGSEMLSDWQTPEGAALGRIYARHLNGPTMGPAGSSTDDAPLGTNAAGDAGASGGEEAR